MSLFPVEFIQPSACLIKSKTFTEITSYGFNDEVAKRGNPHKWTIDFRTRKLVHADARELQAFMDSLDGRYTTFTLPSPLPYMGAVSSFNSRLSASAGDNSIEVKNLNTNGDGDLKAGDYLNFSNHDKVYKIINSVDGDGSGNATMVIHPRLFVDIAANQSIVEGVFSLRLTSDNTGLNLSGSSHNIIKISAAEA